MPGFARYTPILAGKRVVRAMSVDLALLPHIGDAISRLSYEWVWTEIGDPVADIIDDINVSIEDWYGGMLIGTVQQFIVTPPAGWLVLDGSTYAEADYPDLFALLPAHLKSGSNFTLPDAGDAFPYHVDIAGDAATVAGDNSLTLTEAQLPSHTHNYLSTIFDIDIKTVGTPDPGGARQGPLTATTATGSGQAIDRRPLRFGVIYAVYAGRD